MSMAAVPIVPVVAAALLPTCLGFWRREYGVSYAYGGAIGSVAALALSTTPLTPLAVCHATVHLLYGVRLNAFLLWREVTIPRFREMRERIEGKAPPNRLARTPFIISCALLYACMSAPVLVTAATPSTALAAAHPIAVKLAWFGVGTAAAGWAVAAGGDAQKSYAKAKGAALVTTGIFSRLRHPNYTGEALLWSASSVTGVAVSLGCMEGGRVVKAAVLAAIGTGLAGILFVLTQAATGLEKRQREEYGSSDTYAKWVARTWSGPTFGS